MKFTLEIKIFCKRSLALMGHHSADIIPESDSKKMTIEHISGSIV